MRKLVFPTASRGHVLAAKLMGATMWCWIFWRFKHDSAEVFVSLRIMDPCDQLSRDICFL